MLIIRINILQLYNSFVPVEYHIEYSGQYALFLFSTHDGVGLSCDLDELCMSIITKLVEAPIHSQNNCCKTRNFTVFKVNCLMSIEIKFRTNRNMLLISTKLLPQKLLGNNIKVKEKFVLCWFTQVHMCLID